MEVAGGEERPGARGVPWQALPSQLIEALGRYGMVASVVRRLGWRDYTVLVDVQPLQNVCE